MVKHVDSDFNLATAAELSGTTVPALRTMIARKLLNYAGPRPLAGAERKLSIAGIYELALIDELEKNGLSQHFASTVVRDFFDREILIESSLYAKQHPELSYEAAEAHVRANSTLWIRPGTLGKRDLTKPQLLLFSFPTDYPYPLFRLADGWSDVPEEATALQWDVRTFGRSTVQEAREYVRAINEERSLLPDNHLDVQSILPVIQILNVTVVLQGVDERISGVE